MERATLYLVSRLTYIAIYNMRAIDSNVNLMYLTKRNGSVKNALKHTLIDYNESLIEYD